jgi:isopentenyl diphosphate isomerase/L-lactate dehydrogenase-like FMN-dependent dehydrogenase
MQQNPPLYLGEGLGVRSTEKAVEMMKLTKRQIEITMFAAGARTLEGLKVIRLAK